jgi:starch synthase
MDMNVLFATPECAPLVKTGGLGDVSAALPAALRAIGVDARVLMPGYRAVLDAMHGAKDLGRFDVFGHSVRLLEGTLPGEVPLIVVDQPDLFDRRGGPYQSDEGNDWEDNGLRFGVLSKVAAVLGSMQCPLAWRPHVVHCNDWPTALAPAFLRFAKGRHAASLTTIHNLAFQGIFEPAQVRRLELPPESYGTAGLEFYGRISFLKGGLVYADAINTVSPTYAREIQTEELGFGLEGVLRMRRDVLHGVLNGVDTDIWNPRTDALIAARYDEDGLAAKRDNKRALKERVGLGGDLDRPLLAMVTRLTHQKGIDLVIDAAASLIGLGAQLLVVGTGDRDLVGRLHALQAHHPHEVGLFIGFDESLAHLVEAGADMFLMPSRFEPCGMNQMYSQRYGTPPIANATGGLVDTIDDEATGFLMRSATPQALLEATRRALAAYRDAARWQAIQRSGMAKDFGWASAARAYVGIYEKIKLISTSSGPSRSGA